MIHAKVKFTCAHESWWYPSAVSNCWNIIFKKTATQVIICLTESIILNICRWSDVLLVGDDTTMVDAHKTGWGFWTGLWKNDSFFSKLVNSIPVSGQDDFRQEELCMAWSFSVFLGWGFRMWTSKRTNPAIVKHFKMSSVLWKEVLCDDFLSNAKKNSAL